MITTPATFVVGAGGSCPYGLPSGFELRQQAAALAPSSPWYQLIRHALESDGTELSAWLTALNAHTAQSIDDFLLTFQDDPKIVLAGRATIAALIGKAIASSHLKAVKDEEDWLTRVFRRMTSGVPRFDEFIKRNKGIRFVTFNFDSIIESRLVEFVQATFPRDFDRDRCVDAIPVIHVHGRLPDPPRKLGRKEHELGRDWYHWIDEATDAVKVIHDSLDTDDVKAARAVVGDAKLLLFMGMQYWPSNLERLAIGGGISADPSRHTFGTAMRLSPVDTSRIMRLLHPITLTNSTVDSARALDLFSWLETDRASEQRQSFLIGDLSVGVS